MAVQTHDPHCIFCKIVAGEIPSTRVLETDHAIALLDIKPLNPGHTLLVLRTHHPHLDEVPDDLAAHCGSLLPRLCRAVEQATGAEGLNVVVNNGAVAGQTIDHVHWHIIPRTSADRIHWPWPQGVYAGDELARMKARIVHELETSTAGPSTR